MSFASGFLNGLFDGFHKQASTQYLQQETEKLRLANQQMGSQIKTQTDWSKLTPPGTGTTLTAGAAPDTTTPASTTPASTTPAANQPLIAPALQTGTPPVRRPAVPLPAQTMTTMATPSAVPGAPPPSALPVPPSPGQLAAGAPTQYPYMPVSNPALSDTV